MLKHATVLLGLTVLVFGTIFLFTSDWLFNQPPEDTTDPQPATAEQSAPVESSGADQQEGSAQEDETVVATAPDEDPTPDDTSPSDATVSPEVPAQDDADASPSATEGSSNGNEEVTPVAAADMGDILEQGQEQFEVNCQACHGASGEGGVGPALAESPNMEDEAHVVNMIVHGSTLMPPFGEQLSDDQIAAVASFIRNTWGNEFGAVSPDTVAAAR